MAQHGRRLVVVTVFVALTVLGLTWPLLHQLYLAKVTHGSAVDAESTITDYSATYRIDAEGRLTATEVLTVDLPAFRHGIFRFFPAADPTDPRGRLIPTISAITMDHQPVPVSYSWRDDRSVIVVQIGDPDVLADPGLHTYSISYTIDGVLVRPPSGSGAFTSHAGANRAAPSATFYYNAVGFWAMKIDRARVVIDLPGPSGLVQCAADTSGVTPCGLAGAGSERITVTAANLPPQNPVTVRVDLDVPLPDRAGLPWSVRFDKILGRSVSTVAVAALLSALAAAAGYVWARRSREPEPGHPVMYVPPDGLGPVQTVYIVNETVGDHALVATLLYLAERNVVRLSGGSRRWTITGAGAPEQWAALDPVSRKVGEALGVTTVGEVFRANGSVKAGRKLSEATIELTSSCSDWADTEGLMVTARWERVGRIAVGLAIPAAVAAFWGLFTLTMWGLPFAAFVIAGIGLLSTGVGTRRTPPGRGVWSRAAGFERLLATSSSEDRFDFSARNDLFTAYIPFAAAFGVADRWAQKYRTAVGSEPPTPGWYPVQRSGSPAALYSSSGFRGFDTVVAASISAYRSSQSSSSSSGGSGFSSSGGSWGGGGGGGGGTW
ncbi:DUF2207 domain-containing protein [[Mycobacterium] nativiensis]|uniref:DUF2207 domain-containing protein n=1 Tax=[Mycobacterium] nativiensis TaxID=2855503 RepID=A0ABU5Y1R8_9MYCO|nr:DUF2207 domain-containing protein [Mycolicibacter sp. MYC340]MEB3034187.1 DUF2207 domain-containing protein [Mycolicibacter sp. MYC340]